MKATIRRLEVFDVHIFSKLFGFGFQNWCSYCYVSTAYSQKPFKNDIIQICMCPSLNLWRFELFSCIFMASKILSLLLSWQSILRNAIHKIFLWISLQGLHYNLLWKKSQVHICVEMPESNINLIILQDELPIMMTAEITRETQIIGSLRI